MMRSGTSLLGLLCLLVLSTRLTAQQNRGGQDPENPLQPMAFLAESCWRGTFPGKTSTDEHCFSWMYGRKFLRDRHVVRGADRPYEGETTYAWDPKARRIVWWYVASDGANSTGHATLEGDALVIPESYVSAQGARELRNVWKRTGTDSFLIQVLELLPNGQRKELWTMEMRRTGSQ